MARLKQGLFGGFVGRVGNLVGVSRKDTFYVRTLPAKINDPKTERQVKQRNRFTVSMDFLRTMTPFVRVGFKDQTVGGQTEFNAAMSYNMRHAIKTGEEGVELDFPNVFVSRGSLDNVTDVRAEIVAGELRLDWDAGTEGNARWDDIAMLVVHNVEKVQSVYDLNAGKRASNGIALKLPESWENDPLEAYLAFKTADGSEVSDSAYAGRH